LARKRLTCRRGSGESPLPLDESSVYRVTALWRRAHSVLSRLFHAVD
jgi:hypothetical protein